MISMSNAPRSSQSFMQDVPYEMQPKDQTRINTETSI